MVDDFRLWFGDQVADQRLTAARLARLLRVQLHRVEDWLGGRALPTRRDRARLSELLEAPSFVVLDLAGYNLS